MLGLGQWFACGAVSTSPLSVLYSCVKVFFVVNIGNGTQAIRVID